MNANNTFPKLGRQMIAGGLLWMAAGISAAQEGNTLPVRLMHVESAAEARELTVSFTSASEVANAGYSIAELENGNYRALSARMQPSAAAYSAEAHEYRMRTTRLPASGNFYIVDHDLHGGRVARGPFLVGQRYGARPQISRPDWAKASAERTAGRAEAKLLEPAADGARLWVKEPGFYRVSAAMLQSAGVDLVGAKTADIAITYRGRGVPRRINAEGASFTANSSIDFLVRSDFSLYSSELAYLVKADGVGVIDIADSAGVATEQRPVWYWASERYAPDRLYNIASPGRDPWQADRLLAERNAPATVGLQLTPTAVAAVGVAARIETSLVGVSDWPGRGNDHHVTLSAQGRVRGEAWFDGSSQQSLTVTLPALAAGTQTIAVSATGKTGFDFDLVHLDSVELIYPRLPVATEGRLYMQRAQTGGKVSLDRLGMQVGSGSDARRSGFVASGFGSGETIAYAGRGQSFSRLLAVGNAVGGKVVVPVLASADEYFVANIDALPVPRVEALTRYPDQRISTSEYIILMGNSAAPEQLRSGDPIAALLALQQSRGLSAQAIDVNQVYQVYGNGMPEATAIRAFLQDAWANHGARYVLLVGADTYDYQDNLGLGSISMIPTLYQPLSNGIQFAPSDSALADFDDDGVPELAVGRLPVRNTSELQAMTNKLLAITDSNPGRSALLVAGASDTTTDFKGISDDFATRLAGGWQTSRVYVDDLGLAGANNALISGLNAGHSLISFVGHSAPQQWSTEDQTLLGIEQVASLDGRVSDLVLQWGCWNSYFVSPEADTLAHSFLLADGHGAAAMVGISTLGEVGAHEALGKSLYPQLVPGARIGDALLAAKHSLDGEQSILRDILLTSSLLGDPAMPIR